MAKPKSSSKQTGLEEELRSMILSNVRIGSNESSGTNRDGSGHRARGALHQQHGHQQPQGTTRRGSRQQVRNDSQPGQQQHPQSASSQWTGYHPTKENPKILTRPEMDQSHPAQISSHVNARASRGQYQRNRESPNTSSMKVFISQCEYLDRVAATEILAVVMDAEECRAKVALQQRLQHICQLAMREKFPLVQSTLNLRSYGSLVSGFATKGSDLDMTITWVGPMPDDTRLLAELPRVLEREILSAGLGARLLSRTRVPIIKICETPSQDLFNALEEERGKWEALPDDEKYPELRPPPSIQVIGEGAGKDEDGSTNLQQLEAQLVDPDVSRSGKAMMIPSAKPPMGTVEFLEHLKSAKRSDNDDLQKYCQQFIKSATNLLQKREIDDLTACNYFLEGLSPAAREEATVKCTIDPEKPQSFNFADVCKAVLAVVAGRAELKNISQATAPKIWYRERARGPLDFPKSGAGIQCDINFSNPLGIHNTELLRCYSCCDLRVRPMVIFIKTWAGRRRINSAYSGTLSSYGYVLMVLHFLVNIAQPPVLPNLQHCFGASQREVLVDGHNVSFWNDEQHIIQMAAQHQLTQNSQPLGVLLRNFFHYYAAQGHTVPNGGFNWMRDIISLRTPRGLLSKASKGWTGAKTTVDSGREVRHRYLFCIEDPFEIDHNVGRPVTHPGIVAIRDEFRRAWRILLAVGHSREIEGELLEPLQEQTPIDKAKEQPLAPSGSGTERQDVDSVLPALAELSLGVGASTANTSDSMAPQTTITGGA